MFSHRMKRISSPKSTVNLSNICLSISFFSLETVLTKKAYSNSCLLITFYTRSDIDQVNILDSPERQRLLDEFRSNPKYRCILDCFENRIFFVDIREEEHLENYFPGSMRYIQYRTINEIIFERKQIVYQHLSKFIEYFSPGKTNSRIVQIVNYVFRKIRL